MKCLLHLVPQIQKVSLLFPYLFKHICLPRVSIRVGDHNTATENDCDDLGCIDKFKIFHIIEKIVHKEFHETKKGRLINDIALLKTDNEITFSFSVAPICLPSVINSLHPPINGSTLTVAGWGDNGIGEQNKTTEFLLNTNLTCIYYLQRTLPWKNVLSMCPMWRIVFVRFMCCRHKCVLEVLPARIVVLVILVVHWLDVPLAPGS